MNYKAIFNTKTSKLEFGAKSKQRLLIRLLKEVKKINDNEIITLSTMVKGNIDGYECYTPCYPCEFASEDFTKEELLEKLKDYFNSILKLDFNK